MRRAALEMLATALALPAALLLAAEAGMRAASVRSDTLALPSDVGAAFGRAMADPATWHATAQTLGCALAGLALGGGLGWLGGMALGLSRTAAELASVSIGAFRHMPPVALIPIATLALGLGAPMEVSLVAFTCFWPMLLMTQSAVRAVEPTLLDVAKILRLDAARTLRKIVLPATAEGVFVALRLTAGIALIVAVTTEVAANPIGLGYAMVKAQQEIQPAQMFAYLLWLAIVGWAANAGLVALQRALFARAA